MRRSLKLALPLLLASLAAPAGEFQADLKARRERAMERLGPKAMLILRSAPTRRYSHDVDYEYRQDSNFYYLTGIEQEDTVLVLMPGNTGRREILFLSERDPVREHWMGRMLSREEAAGKSGIETVYSRGDFDRFLGEILGGRPFRLDARNYYETSPDFDAFLRALRSGEALVALALEPQAGPGGRLSPAQELASRLRERYAGFEIRDITGLMAELRQVKTPYERKVLRRSVEISAEAHLAGMRAARPGAYEYEVRAAIEQVFRARGAQGWSYPPIVGSGPNATILHYTRAARRMEAGDLLLVDAAANYEYLTGDITRTYPVNGSFTPAQRDLYGLALEAYEAAARMIKPGVKLGDLHLKTVEVVKAGLHQRGLLTDTSGDQYKTWYTHSASHFIGMDVHDVGSVDRPLEPGFAFVLEPGIYIQENALENLPKTPENAVFIEKVRPAFEKYKNVGVRVEDSFLLTESGALNLSAKVPRTVEEIERFMRDSRAAGGAGGAPAPAEFAGHTIATDLKGGYQVVPADLNRDGRIDLIAVASGMPELVWYENPGWRRHVIAANQSRMINLAAWDTDGDGIPEIVLASGFSNQAKNSAGTVSVLRHNGDPAQPWSVTEIDRLTTSHRLRWADIEGDGRKVLVNAPLTGASAEAPDYRGRTPLVFYRPGEWKRQLIGDENEGVVHGIHVVDWDGDKREDILTASFAGIHVYRLGRGGRWSRQEIAKGDPAPWPRSGASDVAVGRIGETRFVTAIEPWHGQKVAVYRQRGKSWERRVIEESLVDGHTILAADLNGDGADEIIAGYRGTGRSVHVYYAQDRVGERWSRRTLDDGGIAAAACAVADLNGDQRPDVACIGSATANLKWYENRR